MTVTSGVSFQQHPRQFSDAPISTASIVIMARLLDRTASAAHHRDRAMPRFWKYRDLTGSFTTSNKAPRWRSQVIEPRFPTRLSIIPPIKPASYARTWGFVRAGL